MPLGDVLAPDLFGDFIHFWDRPGSPPGNGSAPLPNEAVASAFAAIAAHDGMVVLGTESVGRMAAWFEWAERPARGADDARMMFEQRMSWPLPNLVLAAPPSRLAELLRLPAAKYGVVVGCDNDASLLTDQYRKEWVTDFTQRVSALLLTGDWAQCSRCRGSGYALSTGAPPGCAGCAPYQRGRTRRRGDGLSPAAWALTEAAEEAGVEVYCG